ncbi:MAG: kelch repeat-containing protein [Pseudomonadota bacterium]
MNRREALQHLGVISAGSLLLGKAQANTPSWHTAQALPIAIQEIYPTVFENKLVVAGGIAARLSVPYFTSTVHEYDPGSNTWHSLPDLPEDLHHVALISHQGKLLAIGGFNGAYTHVWRMRDRVYELAGDEWIAHSNLPTPQAEGVVTSHQDVVHIVTGQQPKGRQNRSRSDHTEGNLHWVLDRGQWDSGAPIPTPRNSATGGWVHNELIIAGGRTAAGNLDATEIYDSREDRWRVAAPLPLPQAGTAGVSDGRSLYVFGGEIFTPRAGVFAQCWRYDPSGDRWHALPDLPIPRHGLGAGLIDNNIHVIGGATEPGGSGTSKAHEVLTL